MAEVPHDQTDEKRTARGTERKAHAAGERELHLAQQDAEYDGEGHGQHAEGLQMQICFGAVLHALFGIAEVLAVEAFTQLFHLGRHIAAHKLGIELNEKDHANHAEGIGDAIAHGGQGFGLYALRGEDRSSGFRGGCQARSRREGAGIDANGEIKAHVEELTQTHRNKAAHHHDHDAQRQEGVDLLFEIAKKNGTCDHADGADEDGQAEITDNGWNLHPEMSENKRYQKDAGGAEGKALDLHRAKEIAKEKDQEDRQKAVHAQTSSLSVLKLAETLWLVSLYAFLRDLSTRRMQLLVLEKEPR